MRCLQKALLAWEVLPVAVLGHSIPEPAALLPNSQPHAVLLSEGDVCGERLFSGCKSEGGGWRLFSAGATCQALRPDT